MGMDVGVMLATMDLSLVRMIRAAMNVAPCGVPGPLGTTCNNVDRFEQRRVFHPEPRIEPRRVLHPTPRIEPRRVYHPTPRIEARPVVKANVECDPAYTPKKPISPLPAAWQQPIWQRPVAPATPRKASVQAKNMQAGTLLDVFI